MSTRADRITRPPFIPESTPGRSATTRHNLLAYGFLRGVPYGKMEPTAKREPDWKEVKRHAKAFCPDRTWSKPWPDAWEARWKEWLEEAKASRHKAA